jgi:hypothetical protein
MDLDIKLEYLMLRLQMGLGHQPTLIREIVKTHNQKRALTRKRANDLHIQGWTVVRS